jgi:NADH-quinone oxidoreductase subunit F
MPDFEPILLKRINAKADPGLDAYRADGGYAGLTKALTEMTPVQVIDVVKNSGLRGRGGAGFPCGVKWTFLPKDHPGPIYLCVNADESEPCTFNNRILMEQDPHQVLEGILLACYATRASVAYVYIRYEYGAAYRAMQKAIDELYAAGMLGKNIQSSPRPAAGEGPGVRGHDFSLEVYMHRGAGAYICGEETGLIESLEGKRGWPRIKPPFPAVEGAFRKPTVVNNIETLACVTHIVKRGADWFKSIGIAPDPKNPRDAGSYGPKLYCISGHVNTPCCVELPLGISVRELVDKFGGGVWKGLMTEKEFDTPLDFNGPGKVGCLGLGTAAVTIFDEQTSIVDVLYNICRFFAHESCGQCTPCREGTGWMMKIMDRMRRGRGRKEDLDILDEVAKNIGIMPGTTICGLADGAGWPIKNAIAKFRPELEDYIKSGQKTKLALVGAH